MPLTVVLLSGFVCTRTAEELAVPTPRRQNNGSRLVFKHPPGKVCTGPLVRINDRKDQAGKEGASQDRAERHRHPVVSQQGLVDCPRYVVRVKFASLGECFIKAFTHGFLELCAGESGRARGEFVDGVGLGVPALLREMNGEDLLADCFRGEVNEEDLIETSFAEQLRR